MADLAVVQANAMLAAGPCVPGTTYYLSLHSGSPGTSGANEIAGGNCARQPIQFGSPSAGEQTSTDAQSFMGMPAESGGAPYFGLWTASSGGTYVAGGSTNLTSAIVASETVQFSVGGITLSLS